MGIKKTKTKTKTCNPKLSSSFYWVPPPNSTLEVGKKKKKLGNQTIRAIYRIRSTQWQTFKEEYSFLLIEFQLLSKHQNEIHVCVYKKVFNISKTKLNIDHFQMLLQSITHKGIANFNELLGYKQVKTSEC